MHKLLRKKGFVPKLQGARRADVPVLTPYRLRTLSGGIDAEVDNYIADLRLTADFRLKLSTFIIYRIAISLTGNEPAL